MPKLLQTELARLALTLAFSQCFTYATMFSIESLALAGENYSNSSHVERACEFLLGKQMEDGGWGESYKVRCRQLTRSRGLPHSMEIVEGPEARRR